MKQKLFLVALIVASQAVISFGQSFRDPVTIPANGSVTKMVLPLPLQVQEMQATQLAMLQFQSLVNQHRPHSNPSPLLAN